VATAEGIDSRVCDAKNLPFWLFVQVLNIILFMMVGYICVDGKTSPYLIQSKPSISPCSAIHWIIKLLKLEQVFLPIRFESQCLLYSTAYLPLGDPPITILQVSITNHAFFFKYSTLLNGWVEFVLIKWVMDGLDFYNTFPWIIDRS